jgi:hypothetical protein
MVFEPSAVFTISSIFFGYAFIGVIATGPQKKTMTGQREFDRHPELIPDAKAA